jgi:hypothetical protein
MVRRVTKRRVLGVVVLGLVGALAFASADRCGVWPQAAPVLAGTSRGEGALLVGAAAVAVVVPEGTLVGGYGPLRTTGVGGDPVHARATVIEAGGTRVAVVSLEVLLLPQPLVDRVRDGLGLPVVVTATHTHSSLGQFDRRPASQVAALGRFDERVEASLVTAARQAVTDAQARLTPVTMEVRTFGTAAFVRARSGDAVDPRGLEVRFTSATGQRVARWLLLGAHATLAPRRSDRFDTDWPGVVAAQGDGVTLVLQTSVGNATINREATRDEAAVAAALEQAVGSGAVLDGCGAPTLSLTSAHTPLPRPDGSRLVTWPLRGLAENALCASAEMEVEVTMLRLGCVSLLALPVEPSYATSKALEQLTGATRVVGLANGYVGYLEPADLVREGLGEAKRQWFGPELLDWLTPASALVAATSRPKEAPHVEGQ